MAGDRERVNGTGPGEGLAPAGDTASPARRRPPRGLTPGEVGGFGLGLAAWCSTMLDVSGIVPFGLGAAGLGVLGAASAVPGLRWFGGVRTHVREGIALTIDDGPDPVTTPPILDALAAADAHATFFLLADRAARHPWLVEAIVSAGHEVGLHGREHSAVLTVLPRRWGADWLRRGADVVEAAGAPRPTRFRPPFGAVSPPLFASAAAAGLEVTWCSVRTWDGVRIDPAALRARLDRAVDRDIVLIHDGNPVTAAVLPDWLARARGPVRSVREGV